MTAVEAVIEAAEKWLDDYGPVETYTDGSRGCTQLDHGYQEYERRMDLIVALEALLAEAGR